MASERPTPQTPRDSVSQHYWDKAIEESVRTILSGVGLDFNRPGLKDTPKRVANWYREFIFQEAPKMTTFPNEERYSQMVVIDNIPFYSLCEHHMLPFFGYAHIAYIPGTRILGLSKFARWVQYRSANLHTQESLTEMVASDLCSLLECGHLAVMMEAEHLCMSMRGAKVPGTRTTTTALRGDFLNDVATRNEFYQIIQMRRK